MLKKSKIGLCLLCMVSIVVLIPFESKAAVYDAYLDYPEPATSDNEGYLVTMWRNNSTGSLMYRTYFWYTVGETNGYVAPAFMHLTFTNNSVTFSIAGPANKVDSVYYHLSEITEQSKLVSLRYSSTANYVESLSAWTLYGVYYSGNVGAVTNNAGSFQSFVPYFSDDGTRANIQAIYQELLKTNSLTQQQLEKLQQIINSETSIDSKLSTLLTYTQNIYDELVENNNYNEQQLAQLRLTVSHLMTIVEELTYSGKHQLNEMRAYLVTLYNQLMPEVKETNSWLEKIFNWLKDSPEQERQEATTQGNSSVSSGTSNIDDKGASFGESLGGLVSSLSYSGTDCTWTFPQVKLPAISGVMSETVLIQEQAINFTEWINKIPSDILLLIQSFSTCALIVYCFKELYSTISYALTLKGGGADE